jgi:hypothetical protein
MEEAQSFWFGGIVELFEGFSASEGVNGLIFIDISNITPASQLISSWHFTFF